MQLHTPYGDRDLKSTGPRGPWGFESLALRHSFRKLRRAFLERVSVGAPRLTSTLPRQPGLDLEPDLLSAEIDVRPLEPEHRGRSPAGQVRERHRRLAVVRQRSAVTPAGFEGHSIQLPGVLTVASYPP